MSDDKKRRKRRRRRKKNQITMIVSLAAIILIAGVSVSLIWLAFNTKDLPAGGNTTPTTTEGIIIPVASSEIIGTTEGADVTENSSSEDVTDTQGEETIPPEIETIITPSSGSEQNPAKPPVTGDELLDLAARHAAMYDYDKAIEMLKGSAEYSSNAAYQSAVSEFELQKASVRKWPDNTNITHIFFHTLIYDNDKAFAEEYNANKYNQVMTTISEFNLCMEQMYERGYVLVSLYDIARMEQQPDGSMKMVKQPIYLPEGKKPFVLSQDDVSYYEYMIGDGFASRLVVQEDGTVTCEMDMDDGSRVRGSFDMIPLLEDFIEEHPDFSYRGARGTIALTGYNGVFGYRTSRFNYGPENEGRPGSGYLYPNYNIDADIQTATEVADALKNMGWTFATHGWGHKAMGQNEYSRFTADLDRWIEEVIPIIGPCDIVIYPNGDDVGNFWQYTNTEKQNEDCLMKYSYMKDKGFDYFCNVDSNPVWVQITDEYVRQGRRNVDGTRMYEALVGFRNLLDDIIDVETVWDRERPEPVAGVKIPDGYVIGTYSDRT